jgi:prepilin peptidase CpaA
VTVAIFVVAVFIYAAVAVQDLRQRKVSNALCAGIAVLALVRWAILMQIEPAAWAVASAAILFGIGLVFFALNWLGGGDVKLISATALLIGSSDTPNFLFLMSAIGSALALVLLFHLKLGRFYGALSPETAHPVMTADDHTKVPYAVAVAVAAAIVLFLQIQRA